MKHRILLFLFSGLFAGLWFSACGDEDNPVIPVQPPQEEPKPEPEPEPTPPTPTDCTISLAVDWSAFGENPSGMTALFYPEDGSAPMTQVVQQADTLKANLTPGVYDIVLFNDSIGHFTTIGFRGMETFDTAELYLLPQKRSRADADTPVIVTGELEPIALAVIEDYEVTTDMLTSPANDTVKVLELQPQTIDAVTSVHLEVSHIEHVSAVMGAISGMSETYSISKRKAGTSTVTHSLSDWQIEENPEKPGSGWFHTHFASFGPPHQEAVEITKEDVQLQVSIQVEGVEEVIEQIFHVGELFKEPIKEDDDQPGTDTPGSGSTPGGGDQPGGNLPGTGGSLDIDFKVEVDVPIEIPTPDQGGEGENPDQGGEGENPDQGGEGENPDQGGEGEKPDQGGEGENPDQGGEGENPDQGGEGENPDQGGEGENPDQGGGGGTVIVPQPVWFNLSQEVWGGNATALTEGNVGLFVQSNGNYTQSNLPLSYSGGNWQAGGLYQESTNTEVIYTVYTPYNAAATTPTDYTVSVPAAQTAANQTTADFRYASVTSTAATGTVALELKHQLAQVRINLTPGTEFDADQTVIITQVTLSECVLQRSFNLEKGTWNDLAADVQKETVTMNGTGNTFTALLVPQTLTGYILTVVATIDGQEQTYTFTASEPLTITQGAANTLSFTVGHDRIELNKVTVSDWLPGDQIGDNENEVEEVI